MKCKVRVTLQAETTVDLEVEYTEGEDPTDLTPEERRKAEEMASFGDWEVVSAEVIS